MLIWIFFLIIGVVAAVALFLLFAGEAVGSIWCPLDTMEPGRTGVRIIVKREASDPKIPTVQLQFRTLGAMRAVRMRPEEAVRLAEILQSAAAEVRQEST